VRGHHAWAQRREQQRVERRDGEPLVVDDVGVGVAAEAQLIGKMLGELERAAARRAELRL
jgi:hypothetical protein